MQPQKHGIQNQDEKYSDTECSRKKAQVTAALWLTLQNPLNSQQLQPKTDLLTDYSSNTGPAWRYYFWENNLHLQSTLHLKYLEEYCSISLGTRSISPFRWESKQLSEDDVANQRQNFDLILACLCSTLLFHSFCLHSRGSFTTLRCLSLICCLLTWFLSLIIAEFCNAKCTGCFL